MSTDQEISEPKHPWSIRVKAILGSYIAWVFMHLLFLTCRKRIVGEEMLDRVIEETGERYIGASWHRGLFFTVYMFRNRGAGLISSRSKDGEFATEILRRFHYVPQRGSSGKGKGGKQALEEFVDHVLNKGRPGGISTDAPSGPPYVSKHGIVVAAARAKAPLILFNWQAKSYFRVSNWDQTIIPKPFTEIVLLYDDEPMYVPEEATRDELEAYRIDMDRRLNSITYRVDNWFALRHKYKSPRDIPVPEPVPLPVDPPRKRRKSTKQT